MTRRCRSCGRAKPLQDFPLTAIGGCEPCKRCGAIVALRASDTLRRDLVETLCRSYATRGAFCRALGYSREAIRGWREGKVPNRAAMGALYDLSERLAAKRRPHRRRA